MRHCNGNSYQYNLYDLVKVIQYIRRVQYVLPCILELLHVCLICRTRCNLGNKRSEGVKSYLHQTVYLISPGGGINNCLYLFIYIEIIHRIISQLWIGLRCIKLSLYVGLPVENQINVSWVCF